ncbi:MAG: SIR2 family protein [Phycisphaerales bacterium]|nr:SIR2 family protein [Phycisphaerales bacterium]
MPTQLESLAKSLQPNQTVLLFGAGASVPSGAPLAADLAATLSSQFSLSPGYSLSEVAGLVEIQHSRRALIDAIREALARVTPTRGLLNLPLHNWRSLYTTNYDRLIEQAYAKAGRSLHAIASDFDFSAPRQAAAAHLYKLHGDLECDIAYGHHARIVITEADYSHAESYRELLYDRLKADIGGGHLVIVGHSLADPDLRVIVDRAIKIAQRAPGAVKITLLMYSRDEARAQLLEARGIGTCFAGIDDFFAAVQRHASAALVAQANGTAGGLPAALQASTVNIEHAVALPANLSAMFNGWPAQYADINADTTFARAVVPRLIESLDDASKVAGMLIGAGGVGKTTAARQCLLALHKRGHKCFEHDSNHTLDSVAWYAFAKQAGESGQRVFLFVDDAHTHLPQITDLVERLGGEGKCPLQLVLASSRHQWYPRIKPPSLYRRGAEFRLARLEPSEIDDLLRLIESNAAIVKLVEQAFAGFSRDMKRRRLAERCSAELFVCLRNIFASEKFDDIILRDYASLALPDQDVYRHVAAMESAKVVVHRQLVMRLLGIDADSVGGFLRRMSDSIHEYSVNERDGIYAWRGRHIVIADIVTEYKFPDQRERAGLFRRIIDATNPTYEIEVRTLRELCNYESGIASITNTATQNELLRQVISRVPGERVPRHRLIRNLIEAGQYEHAETEIRVFESDFRLDGPTARYKVALARKRAVQSPGIEDGDRVVILNKAASIAVGLLSRFPDHKMILKEYALVGIEVHRRTGDYAVYDDALARLKRAQSAELDPDFAGIIDRIEKAMQGVGHEDRDPPLDVA